MKLEFENITVENFGCLETQTMPLSGLGYGVHFVRGQNRFKPRLGSNGVGKSSIWNAMTWCLTGTTLSGLKSTEVKPWSCSKAVTTVTVSVSMDSKSHEIKRSTISNGLWLDNKVATQEEIYRAVGLTALTIKHAVLLGQGQELFFDLKPTAKMEILSECLDLEKWESRSKRARDAARAIETAIHVGNATIIKTEEQLLRRRHDMRDLKTSSANWESENDDRSDKRDREIAAVRKQLEAAELELGKYDLAYDGAECELRHIRKQLMAHSKAMQEKTAECVDVEATFNALERILRDLRKTARSGKCASCGQVIKDKQAHAEHAAVEIEKQEKARKACESQLNKRLEEKRKLGVAVTTLRQHEDAFNDKSNDAIDGRTRAQGMVQTHKATLKTLNKQTEDAGANPYIALMDKARKDIAEFKALIASDTDAVNRAERKLTRTKYWVDGFKNVRLYLIEEVLDELQGVTNSMLPMIGLDGWSVAMNIERETKSGTISNGLDVTITMDDGRPVNWKAWSGGEGQRLRILGAMALSEVLLRRAGVECDFMVLDEPTKHLSPEGVNETVEFLCDRARDMQIFFIDHTARQSSRFASTITVRREANGMSRITTQHGHERNGHYDAR